MRKKPTEHFLSLFIVHIGRIGIVGYGWPRRL